MLCLRVPLQTDLCGLSVGLKHPSPMPVHTPIVFNRIVLLGQSA